MDDRRCAELRIQQQAAHLTLHSACATVETAKKYVAHPAACTDLHPGANFGGKSDSHVTLAPCMDAGEDQVLPDEMF